VKAAARLCTAAIESDEKTDIVPGLRPADDLSLQIQSGGVTGKVARIDFLQDVDVPDCDVGGIATCVQARRLVDARLASCGCTGRGQKNGEHRAHRAVVPASAQSWSGHQRVVEHISHSVC
jgi:hypothetical protein